MKVVSLEEGLLWTDCSKTNCKSGETLMKEKKDNKGHLPMSHHFVATEISGRKWFCGSGGITKECKWYRRKS